MKILLTGATGMVGSQILLELRRRGLLHRVMELDTSKNRNLLMQFEDLDVVWGDLRDPISILNALDGIDVVFHLAAVIPPLADQYPDLARDVNVRGTENLINAIKAQKQKITLFYASSVSVYGDRLHTKEISVTDPLTPSPFDTYAETKIEAERIIRTSNIPFVIYRLSAVMGPRPGVLFEDQMDPLMYHMPLATHIEMVSSRDVGYAFVESLNHLPELLNNTYNLAGGEKMRILYYTFLNESLSEVGIELRKFPNFVFAEKNFHCGYYSDSHLLNEVLHFQRDTLDTYFRWMHHPFPWWKKLFVRMFHRFVVRRMIKKSEVYQSIKTNNESMIKRFLHFNPNIHIRRHK